MKRFLPSLILVVAVVSSAPFMGLVRDVIFDRFQAETVRYLTLILLILAAAVFLYGIARIREHRLLRYAGLALAAGLIGLQELVLGADVADAGLAARINVAEKIHIVEYGLLAYLLYRAFKPAGDLSILILPLLWVTLAGVVEESMQWLVETRLGEIRDVWLNSYAGLCGLIFSLAMAPPERFSWRLGAAARRRAGDVFGLVILALGVFFSFAHLGYEHFDPQIGRFRSWHSLDELRAAAADRAERWRADPPTELSPWRREDYFLTEASRYVSHRNGRYSAGDLYKAAQANRILETYYDPFLDLESFRGSGKHRYPPEVRAELEANAPRFDPRRYRSRVLEGRIHTWPPKRPFLAVVICVVLAIWGLPRWLDRRRSG